MKAPDFDYLRPSNLDEALGMMADSQGDTMPLAGGQSLMPMMNFRIAAPDALIDLADIAEMRGITREYDSIKIGAMTSYAQLIRDPIVSAEIPLFGLAIPHIAHDAIRNRGTIGGSLALADPAAEMPALMLTLNATIEVAGKTGLRKIKADDNAVLYCYNYRPTESLLEDQYAGPWIKDYAFAHAKLILAEARGKFTQIAGPQGGTTMNADQLRQDAQTEIDKLEMELTLYNDGSTGLGFVIG